MCCKETAKVGSTVKLDIVPRLYNVDSIKGRDETELFERNGEFTSDLQLKTDLLVDVFGNCGVRRGKSKIINLATQERVYTLKGALINVTFVRGGSETKIKEDLVDMFFPEAGSFWMSLECMLDRENLRSVENYVEPV